MQKTISKRILSALLAAVLVFSTFCFAGMGSLVGALETATQINGRPTVTFLVPETIYLTPGATASTATAFQYFVDSDVDGALRADAAQTTGTLAFDADRAFTSLRITCTNTSTGETVFTKTLSGASSMHETLSWGGKTGCDGQILQWEAAYTTADGKTFCSDAYTYLYAPELKQSGLLLLHEYNGTLGDPENHAFLFITGIHSLRGGDRESKFVNTNAKPYQPLVRYSREDTNGGSHIIDNAMYFAGKAGGGVSFYSSTKHDVIYSHPEAAGGACGVITIDASRYSDYNQIPNLRVGYTQFYHHGDGSGNRLFWIKSANGFTDSDAEDAEVSGTVNIRVLDSETPDRTDGDDCANCYGLYALNGTLPSSDRSDTIYAKHKNGLSLFVGTESAYSIVGTTLETVVVNKTALRETYREASAVAMLASEADETFTAKLRNAGCILGKPDATQTQIDTAEAELSAAMNGLSLGDLADTSNAVILSVIAPTAPVHVGDVITVNVDVTQNPGFIGLSTKLNYDPDVLTLTNVQTSGMLQSGNVTCSRYFTDVPYVILWEDSLASADHTETGTILTLTFAVQDDIEACETTVTLTGGNAAAYDFDLRYVPLIVNGASISVVTRSPGDADGDGSRDLRDATRICRYLVGGWDEQVDVRNADVNGDGKVNLMDVTLLRRFLAGWNVTLV